MGVLEIKCPYCHRGTDIQAAADDCNFCRYNANFMSVKLRMEIFVCTLLQWMKATVVV